MRLTASMTAIALAAALTAGTAGAQQQNGLVNVGIGDIEALNDLDIANGTVVQVPIGIAAQVCDVDANVLASEGSDGETVCTVEQEQANDAFINYVTQEQSRQDETTAGGSGKAKQDGLVNVAVGDVTALNEVDILNGTIVEVPVELAAEVCGVDANVLSKEDKDGSTVCTVEQDQATDAFITYVKDHTAA